ncbi:MAG: hypothetical protein ACJ8GN_22850 [Longimicrobiaceae bacterium]
MASLCGGNVSVRSVTRASKPRSAAKLHAQRGATLAAARKARAPGAG